ncbi:vitamin B12 ABC transporter ATP-binding protein BtuD [Mixta theicola]|uniref:Vitamin B12 import ATP-binding protein BtuD n=1 Tax=Mixta theicola TaxID=1458355 RepID=A0A2K1QDU6_9GAMM|nr:vitamin B12 ABC transporter ATP-binding protein BtuD [Mixta theicola]PNS13185.1 vitamin B12 ABC transporter ATP-binding protein BtuD [Mixta theicola]GLR09462.1 vitamin B12 import ATP-binding protein BtuD [Mixta theicola]
MLLSIEQATVPGRLQAFSAQVNGGELIHLLGPNGAGKSSLLARLSGLLPGKGVVRLAGRPLEAWPRASLARRRAWLPQQQPPPGQMAVFHYLQQHLAGATVGQDTLLSRLIAAFQLHDKLTRPLTQLSGGEWQRVRLMAVLLQVWPGAVQPATLLLLDEPYAGLDVAQQQALDRELAAFCRAGGAVITSGHDLNHSLRHARGVWLMQQGKVMQQGRAEAVLQPETLRALYGLAFRKLQSEGESWLIAEEMR